MKNKKQHLPKTISWEAQEFIQHKKSTGWYLGFVLISAGLLIFALFTKSIITIITFTLLVIVVYIFSLQSPRQITHTLSSSGITVGNLLYPFKNIKSFWIVYRPPEVKTLNFETTAYLNNQVAIQLDSQDPIEVKLFLEQYLIEDLDREESLSDIISRNIKF
ncbi:MAG: hypothetical protein HYW51_01365 [Candidatus Doudnabacteria bacterium]|nr:hypothetical protein [Candidatus Doudnabacteria bacterium]